ncbi:MAG: hypothetical protein U5K51_02280 [Flavobacteriaceae bacterium]|nr:hypothetical protein [Flavobacteriaceae bacterium]
MKAELYILPTMIFMFLTAIRSILWTGIKERITTKSGIFPLSGMNGLSWVAPENSLFQDSNQGDDIYYGIFFDFRGKRFYIATGGIESIDVVNNKRALYKHGLFSARSVVMTVGIFEMGDQICIVKNMNGFVRIDLLKPGPVFW